MELADVIVFMREEASRLDRWVTFNSNFGRRQTPTVLGTKELDYERIFGWLERNKPKILIPSKRQYEELVTCVEEVDKLVADGSKTALETAKNRFDKLKYLANRLVNTLRDTADDLMSDEEITGLISNIRVDDIDKLSELFHKLQELPKSRPMPQNESLWSQAETKIRKRIDEAGKKTPVNSIEKKDYWEWRELEELSSLSKQYSGICEQLKQTSLEEMAALRAKEGKTKSPFEAMIEIESKARMDALIEQRYWRAIEKEYRQMDSEYNESILELVRKVAGLIEEIDRVFNSSEPLLKFDKLQENSLAEEFQLIKNSAEIIVDYDGYDNIKKIVEILNAIKSKVELQQNMRQKLGKPVEIEQNEKKKETLKVLAEKVEKIIERLAGSQKISFLKNVQKVKTSVERLVEPEFSFDTVSYEEGVYAEAAVVEYLTKKFGEEDDETVFWPRDWNECPEAYVLYKEKVKEFRVAETLTNMERLEELTKTLEVIITDENNVRKKKRPTAAEMKNRNRVVAMAAAEIKRDYGRLANSLRSYEEN